MSHNPLRADLQVGRDACMLVLQAATTVTTVECFPARRNYIIEAVWADALLAGSSCQTTVRRSVTPVFMASTHSDAAVVLRVGES